MSRNRARLVVAAAAIAGTAAPAAAAPLEFTGEAEARAGYASNPFLRPDTNRGAASIGGRVSGTLTSRTATSTTSLNGSYQRDEYLSTYSASDALNLQAQREQTFSAKLNGNARIYYNNARNAFADPIDDIDIVTAGNRRRTYGAEAGLNATLSARDSAGVSAFGSRSTFASRGFSNYSQYGATAFYQRAFTANTSAGLSMTVSRTETRQFGDTTTYQPNVTFRHAFDAVWVFDGSIGVIFQDRRIANLSEKSTSIGFNGNLCGNYPRSSLCFQASRQTAATGFGGLTTQTSGAVRYTRKMSERSRLRASLSGGKSDAQGLLIKRNQTYYAASAGYDYDLTQRISIGADLDYRYRKFGGFGGANGFSGLITLTAKLGRTR